MNYFIKLLCMECHFAVESLRALHKYSKTPKTKTSVFAMSPMFKII